MQIIVGVFLEMSQEGILGSFRVLVSHFSITAEHKCSYFKGLSYEVELRKEQFGWMEQN